mmetsp:Transcript_117696/g.344716  ORF Transcript_117696/g.344716 Transcript_117696/m.344716 type:complete len:319 (-) Transcript_117696:1136-2092(-)
MPLVGHLRRAKMEGGSSGTVCSRTFSSSLAHSFCACSSRCLTSVSSPSSLRVCSLTSASCLRLASPTEAEWFISMFSTLLFHCTSFHSIEFARTFRSSTEVRSCCLRSSSSSEAEARDSLTTLAEVLRALPATSSCCFSSATMSLCCLSMDAMAHLNSSARLSAMRFASSAPQSCCRSVSFTWSFASLELGVAGMGLGPSPSCSPCSCTVASCSCTVASFSCISFICTPCSASLLFRSAFKSSSSCSAEALEAFADATTSMSLATFEACLASFSASSSFASSTAMWSSASFSFSSSTLDFSSIFCWTTCLTTNWVVWS